MRKNNHIDRQLIGYIVLALIGITSYIIGEITKPTYFVDPLVSRWEATLIATSIVTISGIVMIVFVYFYNNRYR